MTADVVEASPAAMPLHTAILLYGSNQESIAVQHPVVKRNDGGFGLGEGAYVTSSFVNELINLTDDKTALTFIPENVIATSRSAIAWWEPASKQPMYFQTTDKAVAAFDGKMIPQPALLFIARNRGLYVFALDRDIRPKADTKLYCAPYWNVFDSGSVCTGSMEVPKSLEPAATKKWTASFFNSCFTHASGGKKWRFPGTLAELLTSAVKRDAFDSKWLQPTKLTVERALCGA